MIKTYDSNSKPRFDGKGSLFGDLHRELPSGICMFDIDKMFLTSKQELWLKKENQGFIEYRHNGINFEFKALFEVKYKFVDAALDSNLSTNRARIELVKRLSINQKIACRLFIVFQTKGNQPLEFYEIDIKNGNNKKAYHLEYTDKTRKQEIERCWKSMHLL